MAEELDDDFELPPEWVMLAIGQVFGQRVSGDTLELSELDPAWMQFVFGSPVVSVADLEKALGVEAVCHFNTPDDLSQPDGLYLLTAIFPMETGDGGIGAIRVNLEVCAGDSENMASIEFSLPREGERGTDEALRRVATEYRRLRLARAWQRFREVVAEAGDVTLGDALSGGWQSDLDAVARRVVCS